MSGDELYKGFWIDFYDMLISDDEYAKTFPIVRDLIKNYKSDAKLVLELACGTGRYTKYFINAGFVVKATDISTDAIVQAKIRCKNANFEVIDMSKIKEPQIYDVVICLFESFRYNKTYKLCEQTLSRAFKALKTNGLFLCDFGYWPPTKETKCHNEVNMGKGLTVVQDQTINTEGDYDLRNDKMTFNRKDKIIKEENMQRSPLLRISENKMKDMLSNTGFKTLTVVKNFRNYPQSMLFVAQKII